RTDPQPDGTMGTRKRVGKRVNLKAVAILLAATILTGLTIHLVHAHQVRANAHTLVEESLAAEQAGEYAVAIDNLGQYLKLRPDAVPARARLGFLLAGRAESARQKSEAYLTLSAVLRDDPTRDDVRLELARLGLALGRNKDVRQYLNDLRKAGPDDAE